VTELALTLENILSALTLEDILSALTSEDISSALRLFDFLLSIARVPEAGVYLVAFSLDFSISCQGVSVCILKCSSDQILSILMYPVPHPVHTTLL
jgi:hypothetical protein